VGLGPTFVEVLRSSADTPHSAGLLWTRDRPLAENTKGKTSMPPAGLELATPISERLQFHALDRAATGIGGYERTISH